MKPHFHSLRTLLILSLILAPSIASHAQKIIYKESKQPFFKSDEWVMDISEIKIYDDDLIFGRLKFNSNKSLLDTVVNKVNIQEVANLFDKDYAVSEVGDGVVDFYSTKFKKKYTRVFYYFVSSVDQTNFLTFLIDIEESGHFWPLPFTIKKIEKGKNNFEVQFMDT